MEYKKIGKIGNNKEDSSPRMRVVKKTIAKIGSIPAGYDESDYVYMSEGKIYIAKKAGK